MTPAVTGTTIANEVAASLRGGFPSQVTFTADEAGRSST